MIARIVSCWLVMGGLLIGCSGEIGGLSGEARGDGQPALVPMLSVSDGWRTVEASEVAYETLEFEVMARPTAWMDAGIALGSGDLADPSAAPINVRFTKSGTIEARNGAVWQESAGASYRPYRWYRIVISADLFARTYDVELEQYTGRPSDRMRKLVAGAAFDTNASANEQLTTWSAWSSQDDDLEIAEASWVASGSCAPASCQSLGVGCGEPSDGCGGTLSCGSCANDQTCESGACVCTRTSCVSSGVECGSLSDGCGGTLSCGDCASGETCSNGVCVMVSPEPPMSCTPESCTSLGIECGSASDGCDGDLSCGGCASGESCATGVCIEVTPPPPPPCEPESCLSLGVQCGAASDGCGGNLSCGSCGSGETCVSGACVEPAPPPPAPSPGPSGPYPSLSNTGITDYWCPRWNSLKRAQSGDVDIRSPEQVAEYIEITGSGKIHFETNGGVARCIRVTTQSGNRLAFDIGGGNAYGSLTEDVHLAAPAPATGNMVNGNADANTMRRVQMYPVSNDALQGNGFFLQDSFYDMRWNSNQGSGVHADGVQTSGGCGPLWFIHNTMLTDGDTNDGSAYNSNAALFVQGKWNSNPCEKVPSYVVHDNFLSGGIITSRWSDHNGPILNTSMLDNVFEEGSPTPGGGYCDHKDTNQYTPATYPTPNTNQYCFEYADNMTDTGKRLESVQAACKTSGMVGRGQCPDIEATPTTILSNFTLSSNECTRGQSACNNITLSADAWTNEGARSLSRSSAPGGSFRWRYSCGGSPSNRSAAPCSTQSSRCSGYEDNGADLWYHYPDCDGRSSCDMTGVCDYQSESQGTFTAKIYVEAGPGAAYRPSDHSEASFTVR